MTWAVADGAPLLEVRDLRVSFATPEGTVAAVGGLSFTVAAGEVLGIVGESGSGKTQAAFAVMGLLARNGSARGSVRFEGAEILNLPEAQLNRVRAAGIAMVFQDPMSALNPYMRIADQMAEGLVLHRGLSRRAAEAECLAMLDAVQIPEAKQRLRMYPHEFSGGMRQRVTIAMALLCRPRLLIADEPTTALDGTVQDQIMALLRGVQRDFGMAMVLITHDLGIVAGSCDRVLVMYAGQAMEMAETGALFAAPGHPYTQGLLAAVPRLDRRQATLTTIEGEPPDLLRLPPGCPFAPRCSHAEAVCRSVLPELVTREGRQRRCHLPQEAGP